MRTPPRILRAARGAHSRPIGIALLLTLLVGGAFHQLHHLRDPDCDAESATGTHSCPCAILHGYTSPAASFRAPVPSAAVVYVIVTPSLPGAPVRRASLPGAPVRRASRIASRAPPLD
ncbi:MAG TPA: hypothetical protein VMH61_05900 [Candidatus Acidoferrales bacterium]|nr:hypothetical protein [Candidatus Acidoferrales bacterium]